MPKKVLVTQEFHRKALVALEEKKIRDEEDTELVNVLRNAWIQYMEDHCTEEQMNHFESYCKEYLDTVNLS